MTVEELESALPLINKLRTSEPTKGEMLALLITCKWWIAEELERRGDADIQYEEPAKNMIRLLNGIISRFDAANRQIAVAAGKVC
jgi:hypothetical protein